MTRICLALAALMAWGPPAFSDDIEIQFSGEMVWTQQSLATAKKLGFDDSERVTFQITAPDTFQQTVDNGMAQVRTEYDASSAELMIGHENMNSDDSRDINPNGKIQIRVTNGNPNAPQATSDSILLVMEPKRLFPDREAIFYSSVIWLSYPSDTFAAYTLDEALLTNQSLQPSSVPFYLNYSMDGQLVSLGGVFQGYRISVN